MPLNHGPGFLPWSFRIRALALLLFVGVAVYGVGRMFDKNEAVIGEFAFSSCPACICNCPTTEIDRPFVLLPGFENDTADCSKIDPQLQEELNKHSADLLSEELKLQTVVAEENLQRADTTLLETKKTSSQYQKEAEKCNLGMETCEEAREKAEAALISQKKVTELWKSRAKELGWTGHLYLST